jgi:hypothetical protein
VPGTVTTIDREQREGLYELIRNHLGSIEDFFVALERTKDFAKAERLGLEFAEDFRLLQDIGWGEKDERETFELTMPAHDLMELLQRLHAEAVPVLVEAGDEAQSSREDAETDRRFQLGYETCNKLLDALDPREADRGRAGRPTSRRVRSSCPHGDTP